MIDCDQIDSILDAGRSAELVAAKRQGVAAHLASCERCVAVSAAHAALCDERMGEPPPELWTQVLRRVSAPRAARPAAGRGGWLALAGLVAAASVVVVLRPPARAPESPAGSVVATPVPAASAPVFVAGRDYEVLAAPRAAGGPGKIAVVEFFMYWCFPCFAFEDELTRFGAETQDYVALTRVPAVFNPLAELHARAFYTAEVLGKLDEMHAAFYDEMHGRGNRLASPAELAEFFARFDVDGAAFAEAFDSSEVDNRVRSAVALAAEYGVRAAPTLVVAGKYLTHPGLARADTLAVVKELVAAEAARGGQP